MKSDLPVGRSLFSGLLDAPVTGVPAFHGMATAEGLNTGRSDQGKGGDSDQQDRGKTLHFAASILMTGVLMIRWTRHNIKSSA